MMRLCGIKFVFCRAWPPVIFTDDAPPLSFYTSINVFKRAIGFPWPMWMFAELFIKSHSEWDVFKSIGSRKKSFGAGEGRLIYPFEAAHNKLIA